MSDQTKKRDIVFEAATDVFSRYGFRRTAMNDIAKAAGMSRPALYLLFDNKKSLFRELVAYRQSQAIDEAVDALMGNAPFQERFVSALLAYDKSFYQPVGQSPHGAELIDVSQSVAADLMKKGRERLISSLTEALETAVAAGGVDLARAQATPRGFCELFISAMAGVKSNASSKQDFRRKLKELGVLFMASISKDGTPS